MVSHAVGNTWPGGLSRQKPGPKAKVFVVTGAQGLCVSHGIGYNQILLEQARLIFLRVLIIYKLILVLQNGQFVAYFMVVRDIALLLWNGYQGTQMNNYHGNVNTCFTGLDTI